MSSVHSFPTPHCTDVSSIYKLRNRLGCGGRFFVGRGVSDTRKNCISFVFVIYKEKLMKHFFEFGPFSWPSGSMSYLIPESSIFIEERSSVSEDHQRLLPRACIFTAAAPYMYCLRKKIRSPLRPLNFQYVSHIITLFFWGSKKWEKKIRMAHDGALLGH